MNKESTPPAEAITTGPLLGRFLSNIYDTWRPDAERRMMHHYHDWRAGPEAMREAWKRHIKWVRQNVVSRPKATASHTVEELEAMHMVGIYAPLEGPPNLLPVSIDPRPH